MKIIALSLLVLISSSCSTKSSKISPTESNVDKADFIEDGSSDSGTAGGLHTIYFDTHSDRLTEAAKYELAHNIRILLQHPNVIIQVEGHCDERGGAQFNLALGERRAKSVRQFLVLKGVPGYRLKTLSLGKESPLEHGSNESAWAKNRRASFRVLSK